MIRPKSSYYSLIYRTILRLLPRFQRAFPNEPALSMGWSSDEPRLVELVNVGGHPVVFVSANSFGDAAPEFHGSYPDAGGNSSEATAALQRVALRQLLRVRRLLRCWNWKHRGVSSSFRWTASPPDQPDYWQLSLNYKLYESDAVDGLADSSRIPDVKEDQNQKQQRDASKDALSALHPSCLALSELGDARYETRPVLVLHMPLARLHDEANCTEGPPAEAGQLTPQPWRSTPLIAGVHCMTSAFSQLLLRTLVPRLVIDGHSHHVCGLRHKLQVRALPIINRYPLSKPEPNCIIKT